MTVIFSLISQGEIGSMEEEVPQRLYKITTVEAWEESQSRGFLILAKIDEEFIHLAREDQLDRILSKYWAPIADYYLLTVDPKKLEGRLVFETNPGGTAKYYHLYNGKIPLSAVTKAILCHH